MISSFAYREILNINREFREIKMRARQKVSEQRAQARAKVRAAAAMLSLVNAFSNKSDDQETEGTDQEGREEEKAADTLKFPPL